MLDNSFMDNEDALIGEVIRPVVTKLWSIWQASQQHRSASMWCFLVEQLFEEEMTRQKLALQKLQSVRSANTFSNMKAPVLTPKDYVKAAICSYHLKTEVVDIEQLESASSSRHSMANGTKNNQVEKIIDEDNYKNACLEATPIKMDRIARLASENMDWNNDYLDSVSKHILHRTTATHCSHACRQHRHDICEQV